MDSIDTNIHILKLSYFLTPINLVRVTILRVAILRAERMQIGISNENKGSVAASWTPG